MLDTKIPVLDMFVRLLAAAGLALVSGLERELGGGQGGGSDFYPELESTTAPMNR